MRRGRQMIAALTLVLAIPAVAAADGPAGYQADPAHSGAPAGTKFAPPLGKRWVRRDLGGGVSFPVIAEGKAFVTAGSSLYALNLATGDTIWSRPLRSNGVAYDAGRVFAVDDTGVMQALSAAKGEKLWTASLAGSTSRFSAPTAFGGYVYVSGESTVFGVRQQDGIVVWASDAATSEASIPAVDEDKTYASQGCGGTSALQRTVGAEIWRSGGGCSGSAEATVSLHGDRVYTSDSGSNTFVLDSLTGMLADTLAGGGPPAFAGDSGYYRAGQEVFARSESSGLVQWRTRTERQIVAPLLAAGGYVYALDESGNVLGLSRATGAIEWQRPVGNSYTYTSSSSGPARFPGMAAAGDTLLVASGGRLVAFAAGPDTPGVDDPDKPSGAGATLTLSAAAKGTVFGRSMQMSGRLDASYQQNSTPVEIQADPWPYGEWQHLKDIAAEDSSSFLFRVRPTRNTRYRALYSGTNPGLVSAEVTVFSDVRLAFKVFGRGRRKVLVKVSAGGPPDAGLRRRPVYVYHYRPRARSSRRIGALRLRGRGNSARAAKVLRTPTLRRSDLFFICRREKRDDGFGPPDKRLRTCGRPRVR